MKFRQFMMIDDNAYAMRIAKTSKMMQETISTAHKHLSAFANVKPVKHFDKNVISSTDWFILSNGRFIANINAKIIKNVINEYKADVILLKVEADLMPYRENIRTKFNNEVAGYRRFFFDSILPTDIPDSWPHYIIIKSSALNSIISQAAIPARFCIFIKRCVFAKLKIKTFAVGGNLLDLEKEEDTLSMLNGYLSGRGSRFHPNACISPDSRIYGNVIIDDNAIVESGATIIGPAIIGPNLKVSSSTIIRRSILFSNENSHNNANISGNLLPDQTLISNYRTWPLFSYARLGKRMCDMAVALIALPLILIIFILIFKI